MCRQEPRTFSEYAEHWLKTHAETKLAPKTAERYRSLLAHVTRDVGTVMLAKITAVQLEEVYAKLYGLMSAKSVKHVHGAVHSALNSAVRLKLIPYNPASACVLRQPDPTEAAAFEMPEVDSYLRAAADSWVSMILRTAADSGARRGEILALRWSDLNFETGILVIVRSLSQTRKKLQIKSTKNRQTRRVILSSSTLECLKMHRELQERNRRMFGKSYRVDLDLIFATPEGDFLKPSSVSRASVRLAGKAGLERSGLHTLRHSHASLLLSKGVPIPVVSKRLGHSDPYTTARIYSDALPSDERAADEMWESIVAGKRSPRSEEQPSEGVTAPIGTSEGIVESLN